MSALIQISCHRQPLQMIDPVSVLFQRSVCCTARWTADISFVSQHGCSAWSDQAPSSVGVPQPMPSLCVFLQRLHVRPESDTTDVETALFELAIQAVLVPLVQDRKQPRRLQGPQWASLCASVRPGTSSQLCSSCSLACTRALPRCAIRSCGETAWDGRPAYNPLAIFQWLVVSVCLQGPLSQH